MFSLTDKERIRKRNALKTLRTCFVPWVWGVLLRIVVHSMHVPCRVVLLDGMARSHLSLLNNIFKKLQIKYIVFHLQGLQSTKKKNNRSWWFLHERLIFFSLVQTKRPKNTNIKGAQDRGSVIPVLRCKVITNNCMNKSRFTLWGVQASNERKSSVLFCRHLSLYQRPFLLRAHKTVCQRDHCSLGLALDKYSTVTKRWLPAAPRKKWVSWQLWGACDWIVPKSHSQSRWESNERWGTDVWSAANVHFWSYIIRNVHVWLYMMMVVMNLKTEFTLFPEKKKKNHIWQTKTNVWTPGGCTRFPFWVKGLKMQRG